MPTNMSKTCVEIEISKKHLPVFIDTPIFIYLFEDHPKYASAIQPIFDDSSITKVSSIITVSEVLTKPYEENNTELVKRYQEIFMHLPSLILTSPDYDTAILASQIKAKYQFKLIDSFQLAMAQQNKCPSFLTNDKQLLKYKNLQVFCLDELLKK